MTCGFTGTQRGMTPRQLKAVGRLLRDVAALHLGDCVGADLQAFMECARRGLKTIGHPPMNKSKRTFCFYDEERIPKAYLARNHDIVHEGVDGLIAAPKGWVEERRSGTWATIRYARKLRRQIWTVRPDGAVEQEYRSLPIGCTCGADLAPGRADREAHADSCPRRRP